MWTASQVGGAFARTMRIGEGTPVEAYRQWESSAELVLHDSLVVRGRAQEIMLQAQHSMTIQPPMCEVCPGLQLEVTSQQSDLGAVSTWPGKKVLKKQRPSPVH